MAAGKPTIPGDVDSGVGFPNDDLSGPPLDLDLAPRMSASHRRVVFIVLSAAMMMSSIDQTVVATALPTIHVSLHAPINWIGWTVTAYQLGLVVALPVAGRISDQFGRKRIFLVCIVIFVVSSLLCGLSKNIYMLVACRGLQALGGGGFVPSATGIVADNFGGNRDRAIGMFSSIVPIGSMMGPIVGALIISGWSWRGVFLVNIPIGIIVFLLVLRFVPKTRPRQSQPADLIGVGLLMASLLPLMFGITSLGDAHSSVLSFRFLLPVAVSGGFIALSVRHARRAVAPIIPVHLMRLRAFAAMNVISFMYGGCVLGFGALVPLYAEERFGFSSLQAGTLLTGRAIGAIIVAGATAILLRRIGYRLPIMVGIGVAAVGFVLLGLQPLAFGAFAWLVICSTITGIGNGIAAPATNNALYQFAPGEIATIAGLRGMFRQTAGILSISIVTAIAAPSLHPGLVLGHAFIVFAILLSVIALPLVFYVPNTRGRW